MKHSSLLLISGLAIAGFSTGYIGKHLTHAGTATTARDEEEKITQPGNPGPAAAPGSVSVKVPSSTLHSTDSLETISALEGGLSYSRIALWLLDASEPDIATYWKTYSQGKSQTNDITDLIFLNWTRLDPQAAIAGTAGTKNEHFAWWAWACHDPEKALATALAVNADRVNNVAWGIGEFHPEWLRAHFDQLSESARGNAMRGMAKWGDGENPLDALEFLKKHGERFDRGNFQALCTKDPWAAYDWLQANSSFVAQGGYYGAREGPMEMVIKTMAETQPESLKRLADQTPSGEAKRSMEAALFAALLKTDPAAAIEQALATKAPRIAAERLAAVGLGLVETDPDKALEMTGKLFAAYPDAMSGGVRVNYDHGYSLSGIPTKGVDELVGALMIKDPARLMDTMTASAGAENNLPPSGRTLASRWADQNLDTYVEWVNKQTNPSIHDQAIVPIIERLAHDGHFGEAIEWTNSSPTKSGRVVGMVYEWSRADPDKAAQWLESSDLSLEQKESIGNMIQKASEQ